MGPVGTAVGKANIGPDELNADPPAVAKDPRSITGTIGVGLSVPVGKAKAGKVPAVPSKVKKRSRSVSHGSPGVKVLLEVVFPLIVGITDENRKGKNKASPLSERTTFCPKTVDTFNGSVPPTGSDRNVVNSEIYLYWN